MTEEETPTTKKFSTKKYYDDVNLGKRTKQLLYMCSQADKASMFECYLGLSQKKQTAVVVQSKRRADELSAYLNSKGIKVSALHGNHRKEKLEDETAKFNSGEISVIITTDKILQFLGLENLETIINYDLPPEHENYFNRLLLVDEVGEAISFVSPEEEGYLSIIEMRQKNEIPQAELEGFVASENVAHQSKAKKKKPRHRTLKSKKVTKED